MKKDADEAKKAAAELTARLEALEVEAKAKKEVIVFSCVSLSTTGREASTALCPLCSALLLEWLLFCSAKDQTGSTCRV